MAGATPPRSCLLFADSFHHDRLCHHIDEVRFTEPVIITACEVVELHQSSVCPTLPLKGITSPESCALEFYVRSGRDSRFQRLGPAFLHSPAATSFLDVQAAVTEHMVLRGNYKSLSLVVYGNLASELSLDNKLDTSDLSSTAISKSDPLREVLLVNPPRISTLSNLHLLIPPTVEQGNLLDRLLKCVGGVDATHYLVSMLLTAAAAWHLSPQHRRKGAQWSDVKKLDPLDGSRSLLCDDSVQELLELHNLVQQKEDESNHMLSNDGNGEMLVNLSLLWLQAGLEPSAESSSSLSLVENLVGGLASVQLLCSSYPKDVPAFLAAGGIRLLHQVVEEVSGTTALLLFALTSVEFILRFKSGCEVFRPQGEKFLLTLLENKQRPPVTNVLHRILQRLRCYELAVAFGRLVKLLTNSGAAEDAVTIKEATRLLNDLLVSLNFKDFVERNSAEHNWGNRDTEALTCSGPGHNEFASLSQDIDHALLSVLQETSFMASLAAFSSVPHVWAISGSAPNVCVEFALATQRLLLRLLECRSGLLFLNGDTESLMTLVSGLKNASEQELEVVPIRHVAALSSMGYLCIPGSIAEILLSRLSMVTAVDRFVGADRGSEAAFGSLWDLATMSRSEVGRQAILAIVSFPEVLTSLIEAVHSSSDLAVGKLTTLKAVCGGATGHFAAEILQKVFCDSALANQIALTTHASTMQTALQAASSTGMNTFSKLVEWVEAAVVYKKKGAVGLLKHAAALIGPQNTSTAVHVDVSMDDDATNLRDRAPGSELPNSSSKGLGPFMIQDSAIHALTISLRLLASAGWNLDVAALLYGDSAMGVVIAILDHCVAALQVSSNEYDDEEAEEEEGRGEDLHKEQALLALLLPTLLLLLSLLKCLQGIVQQFCSTRLLDLLTQLHHITSAKSGAHELVPPYSWTGGVLELGAVQQVLASLLAFWPVLSWTPTLLPRLLGPNSSSLPMEPGQACSVICLLEEFLPPERPRLNMDKAAVADVYRSVSVGNVHGVDVMSAVLWHTSPFHAEQMVHALHPYLEQIGQLVVRFVPCKCEAFQDRLANLVIRLACQNPENAAVLVRPILLLLQQRTAATAKFLLGETDVLQVTNMLRWVALLAAHPSSKAVLLQEGVVHMLLQTLSLEATSSALVANLDWFVCSFRIVTRLCDTAVSFSPGASMDRHISEDCPNFNDCCAIATSLLRHCQMMQMEPQAEVLADALEKLASHDVGRAALASVALDHLGDATPTINQDTPESQVSLAFDKDSPPLLKLWQNFASGMRLVELNTVHLRLVLRFAQVANAITGSGQSLVGGVALKALFGLDVSSGTTELKIIGDQDENLEAVSQVVSNLERQINEIESSNVSSYSTKSTLQEALATVSTMLNFLNAPATVIILHEEIGSLLSRLPASRPIAERRAEALAAQTSSCSGLITSLIFAEGANPMDVDNRSSIDETKGILPWDCPKPSHERSVMAMRTLKRRVISTVEVASKRHRGDGTASAVASRTTVVVTSSRRDTFRLRKPNTSRPPSMHVDDYVAREKSSDVLPGTSPATSATQLHRSNSGTERAPSIHVDEFMARQREQQQSATPAVVQGYAENGVTRSGLDTPDGAYDGADLGLTDGNSRMMQPSTEYSNVNMALPGVATFPAAPSPASGLTNTPGMSTELAKTPETLQRHLRSLSASELPGLPLQRVEEMKIEQNSGPDTSIQPPSPVVKVKLERIPSTNSASAGSPSPFRPYEQEMSTSGTLVKKESRQQSERNFVSWTPHGEAPVVPSFSASQNAPSQQAPHSDVASHLPPPPPASPWLDPSRRVDPALLPSAMPRLIPPMNVLSYNHGPGTRPPADLQVGGVVLQPPAGLWRDSPTVFSGLPPPGPPIPGPIQHGPLYVQQPYLGAGRPLEGYPPSHTGSASTSAPRFADFGGPPLGQGSSSHFQPPVPAGIPPLQITQHPEQTVNRPPPLYLQEADVTAQQEPGAVLQQILQSPDTIQELLKDPKKLQLLLEQHPKLITLLQEKMSQGTL